ncbi:uncharacterized protein LOC143302087 [Babylonia areolata]|uniref:uncharacterized protein LOC143301960 n=1 Tax=Babylonia areolata TaxID=304850 RepID=UPI003FD3116D
MSTAEAGGDQARSEDKANPGALDAGASCNAPAEESLEDQLRLLHKQINNSDWLQKNTAEMWMDANPEAAAELKKMFAEKEASQNSPKQESQSSSSQSPCSGESAENL